MKRPSTDTEHSIEEFFGFKNPKTPAPVVPTPEPEPEPEDNDDWDPPIHMDCGHWQLQMIPRILGPGEDSYTSRGPTQVTVSVRTPEECHYCRMGVPGRPEYQVGEYRTPVLRSQRRNIEKVGHLGWPGYCVDDEGYYIGGIGNDCRNNADGQRCEVHRGSI